MALGTPDQVPVMCQMSTGHILLNSGIDPLAEATDSLAYAESLWRMRELYDFDGILMHKPGREPGWLDGTRFRPAYGDGAGETAAPQGTDSAGGRASYPPGDSGGRASCPPSETALGGTGKQQLAGDWLRRPSGGACPPPPRQSCGEYVFPDGSYVRVQSDEDPIFFPPPGFVWPQIDQIDPQAPLAGFSGGLARWLTFKATHDYRRPEEVPEFWYACLDELNRRSAGCYSLHGETRAPFDHVLALLSSENLMVALITEPARVHALMEWATDTAIAWSVAQVRRGCDAIKVSSPWVGSRFISPKAYREFVVPYEGRLAAAVRAEGGFIYTHTCGAINDRLEDMMSSGINGLECLDPPPLGNIDLPDALRRTKGRVFLKGNIDSVNTLLRKTVPDIRGDVRRTVELAAPGGGYICSTACSISPHVPPEHVRALVEAARE